MPRMKCLGQAALPRSGPGCWLLVAAAVSLSAGAASNPSNAAVNPPPLEGSAWTLQALPGRAALPAGNTPTLRFEGSRAAGSDGCNRYTAGTVIDGPRLQFTPRGASTLRACIEPLHTLASEFNAALGKTQGFRVEAGALVLLDAAGTPLARLAAQATGLAGTAWVVTGFHNGKSAVVNVVGAGRPTVQFGADGGISGIGSCNRFEGRYSEPAAGSVEISALTSTRRACESDELNAQEAAVLRALESARSVRREADRLELRRADGALAASLQLTPP
jgi:heat shock protein HslJ